MLRKWWEGQVPSKDKMLLSYILPGFVACGCPMAL